jgi:3-deoxy-D-manno-octulosonic-acid transferase
MYILYNILFLISAVSLIPYFLLQMLLKGKHRKSFGQKFGMIPAGTIEAMKGSPRIWIHAVSVGEVTAAAPIIAELRLHIPKACIVLSTTTETGREMAEKIIREATAMMYFPLDIPYVVAKAINLVKPDIFVMMETELWPNFIRACTRRAVKIALVNGRISPRSFKRYYATRFFWAHILNAINAIGVISDMDEQRLIDLGMNASRIHVFGNSKYDSFAAKASPEMQRMISEKLDITPGEKVLVAGSTHGGEEEIILTVYRKLLKAYPDYKLILIPRHTERAQAVTALAKKEGFEDIITMSEINSGKKRREARIIIVDVIGELFKIYSLATVVFCGGSLVPLGGQNILEPAAWGKVVFFGPYMDDFLVEEALLEASGAGITIHSADELFEKIMNLMENQVVLARIGEKGRQTILANIGAAQKYTELIMQNLP